MDAESLAQIQRIVTTAVSDAEGRLRQEIGDKAGAVAASLRKEFGDQTGALADSLRKEIGEKTGAVVASLRKEFRDQTGALGGSLRQEFGDKTGELAASLREEFREGIEEVKRHSGVLYEDVLHKIDLVVEGHQALHQKSTGWRHAWSTNSLRPAP